MAKKTAPQPDIRPRPPVIAVMGHIDHGKSTLLDFIRNTKVAESEAGGITQRLSAYEVAHSSEDGKEHKITFLDTPGHAAFEAMRSRGSRVADIAVLVVAADDGVKPQTKEARDAIVRAGIPYVVAITKIDKPDANIERVKSTLLESEIYLEGMGGDVPYVALSSKTGEGVPQLLDTLLLVAELEELSGDMAKPAEGVVIESHRDPRKGITATLIIKDGVLHSGEYVVAGGAFAPVRIMEDFLGNRLKEASFSSPVSIVGFSDVPPVGEAFYIATSKKDADARARAYTAKPHDTTDEENPDDLFTVPLIIKADVTGSLEAIEYELAKLPLEHARVRIIRKGVGDITEGDIAFASGAERTLVIGFNVKADPAARESAARANAEIALFDIIYKVTEWLVETVEHERPRREIEDLLGTARVIKVFSANKDVYLLGGRVLEGEFAVSARVRVMREGAEIAEGEVRSLQHGKQAAERVAKDSEFGAQIACPAAIEAGDELLAFKKELK